MGETEKTAGRVVSIDTGKRQSYVVVEEHGKIIKEGYTETSKEGFGRFLTNGDTMIIETSSCFNGILDMIENYGKVVAAYPYKVRLIAESAKKTDKIDAHTLLSLYKAGFLPGSYVPPKRIRELRGLCRDRVSLVEEATALKNRLRYKTFSHGLSAKTFSRTDVELLKSNVFTSVMAFGLEDVSKRIKELDASIEKEKKAFRYAELIDTIPGIGPYSALAIAAEIGEISRFKDCAHLEAYAGLVPRIYLILPFLLVVSYLVEDDPFGRQEMGPSLETHSRYPELLHHGFLPGVAPPSLSGEVPPYLYAASDAVP